MASAGQGGGAASGPAFPNPTPPAPPVYPQQQLPNDSIFYSIDVECVATGIKHNARSVGQISLVDQYERGILNLYVRPSEPVVSYLTPLTGLTEEMLAAQGMPLEQAIQYLKMYLPRHAILVGQNIHQDVSWLGLKEGVDFAELRDLTGLYRVWNPRYNSWSVFAQDHLVKTLLGWDVDGRAHNAVEDACKSIRLFHLHNKMKASPQDWEKAQAILLAVPPGPSFAKRFPTFEGCCMGNRRTCTCGAPFLGS
mmetsp:Transcript_29787/g.76469  ORF Transcript_29787/g.76469 Transcript_29787/m.76469 type:complete len:252 (-) Transcript_29787:293-1048(-)